jgi:hypothetical protein
MVAGAAPISLEAWSILAAVNGTMEPKDADAQGYHCRL